MKTVTMRRTTVVLTIAVLILAIMITVAFGATASGKANVGSEPAEPTVVAVEQIMTVDDVVSKAGCDYFIVKDINSWAVLESDVYMDREVVEINICDDTPNTLCLFIELDENEEPHIRKTSEN